MLSLLFFIGSILFGSESISSAEFGPSTQNLTLPQSHLIFRAVEPA